MRVLVTGATGFIGRQTLAPLLARGCEVHAVTLDDGLDEPAEVRWHRSDLLDATTLGPLLASVRPTHLLHLAWYAIPGKYWTSRENLRWVRASLDLAEAFADAGGRRFVGVGSCAEYDWGAGHCVERETPLAPATLYGASKLAFSTLLEAFARQVGFSAAWGRLFFLFGPHEHPDRLVPSVVRALLAGTPAACTEGTQVRDFLYVKDAAEALVALLASDVGGPVNIASGEPLAVKDLVMRLGEALGRPDLIRLGARPSNEVARLTAATARLNHEVGWSPRRRLDEALAETIAWWQQER